MPMPMTESAPPPPPPDTHPYAPSSTSSSFSGVVASGSMFDVHTLYKLKSSRSYRKLDHLFGDSSHHHHDICVRDIRNEGLKAMLQSKVPLCYFLLHLLDEYSCENLFFFIELEQFQSLGYVPIIQQLTTAQHIYNMYLARNCQLEVNLDDKVRRDVTIALEERDVRGCFDDAKQAVYMLLESSYMRFMHTDLWHRMTKNCGELTTHYNCRTREAAVNQLIMWLEKQHARIYSEPSMTDSTAAFLNVTQSSKRRHDIVKLMLHEFCRTLLGVEFSYYLAQPPGDSMQGEPHPRRQRHVVVFDFFGKKK